MSSSCSYNQPSPLHWGMSVVWQIWRRTNSLMILSNDCLTTINTFLIVAKKEVNKEWRTGTEDTDPKLKWQLLSISQDKKQTSKAILSSSLTLLTGWISLRDLGATTVEIAFGLDPACLGNGVSIRWDMFCKKRHCRFGLFFELLGNKPRLSLNVLWQFWYSVLFAVYPIMDHLISPAQVLNHVVCAS